MDISITIDRGTKMIIGQHGKTHYIAFTKQEVGDLRDLGVNRVRNLLYRTDSGYELREREMKTLLGKLKENHVPKDNYYFDAINNYME